MRFWQKVFLSTLTLFMLFLSLCILFVVNAIYTMNLEIEREKASNEVYWLQKNLENEIGALEKRERLQKDALLSLIDSYGSFYEKQDTYLEVFQEGNSIYSTLPEGVSGGELPVEEKAKRFQLVRWQGFSYYSIAGKLDIPGGEYGMSYTHKLTKLEEQWKWLKRQCLIISLCGSLGLMLVLLILMRRLTQPLELLSKSARVIAKGDFTHRVPVRGHDELAQLSGNFNDMSEEIKKQIQIVTEENRNKQLFIDNLSHEMRTPLTAIYGYAQYIQVTDHTERERYESMEYIMKECQRLRRMDEELLALTTLRGRKTDFWKEVNLEELTNTVKHTLEEPMKKKQIVLSLSLEVKSMWGDAVLLESLIQNLLENAVLACGIHGVIGLLVRNNSSGVRMIITDNGRGMEEEEVNYIMEPFYRIDKSRSRNEGGTGLGLSLCRKIVEIHHGTIHFKSFPGKGTEVTVDFTGS